MLGTRTNNQTSFMIWDCAASYRRRAQFLSRQGVIFARCSVSLGMSHQGSARAERLQILQQTTKFCVYSFAPRRIFTNAPRGRRG